MHTRQQQEQKDHVRRMDDGAAFLPDPQQGGRSHTAVDLAEMAAEGFLASATSGEEQGADVRDQVVAEELGGPFTESTADEELIDDIDGNNPIGAEAEPFPRAMGGR